MCAICRAEMSGTTNLFEAQADREIERILNLTDAAAITEAFGMRRIDLPDGTIVFDSGNGDVWVVSPAMLAEWRGKS
jgi:hypothetical protein